MVEVKTIPTVAQRVDDVNNEGKPGSFELLGDPPDTMLYICPCGCGHQAALAIYTADKGKRVTPSWLWDGRLDKPTLSPSVHHVGHWHGFLRNGIWESA